ncbi:protein of unknown function DUF2190 [Thermoanaerobacter thermohydrosulfuricus WC1]|uniref:DUF2190 family protein n=2 Tax=Thermoanaerobacter TaxID=1754 RepID=D3T345_THEIA|nr:MULTISPECIES: DUF2190 family protein [Thermoanaerobacter]ADD02647.1 conserved hypothetical protein [Thermoanaerobacter italicus Ab9]EMT38897.1 protein of unknown function DUF2190 [Thermoanaerobacter thermohydrosulfuricus WC1]
MARQVSKGRSVKLTVPAGFGPVEANKFYEILGFFGMAVDNAQESEQVVLLTEQAEYETSQTDAAINYNVGDKLYFDPANKVFTTAADDGAGNAFRLVGRVTQGKDTNGVIWFILGPQV